MTIHAGAAGPTLTRSRARRTPTATPGRFAAIDIGSNSIRLVVAEAERDGSYRVLDEERDMARLGQGLAKSGRLGQGPMRAALHALAKMAAIARGHRAEIRAVATSAVRDAKNGSEFRRLVQKALGLRLEIITGKEEGLLAFRSALRHFDLAGEGAAVVDIGGGSLEVVLAKDRLADEVHSLPLGTVRLMEEHCLSDPLRPKHARALRKEIDKILRKNVGKLPFRIDTLVGSGGTFTALAQIDKAARGEPPGSVQGYALTLDDLERWVECLRSLSSTERAHIPGLNPRRADIILPGAIAIQRIARYLKVKKILVNERGIRDGLLLAMIEERVRRPLKLGKAKLQDRLEWVRLLARKCHSSFKHCEHVARLALQIHDGLAGPLGLPESGREILESAAILHDIGNLINHEGNQKHAYHLIVHSGLTGFSADELELIANVVRYHCGSEPKKAHANYAQLRPAERRVVRQLSGLLRIADALDRTQSQRVTSVSARVARGKVVLQLEAREPPQVEVWDATRRAGLFEDALGLPTSFVWKGKRSPRPGTGRVAAGPPATPRRSTWAPGRETQTRAARSRPGATRERSPRRRRGPAVKR